MRLLFAVCAFDQQYFQLGYLPVKSSGNDISSFFKKKDITLKVITIDMRLSCYWGIEYHTTTKEYCNLCAIYGTTVSAYDTNNCKGLLAIAWGYKFLQSWGAKDCLAMNHLNEWTLGKRKQNTNRPKQPRIQSCG